MVKTQILGANSTAKSDKVERRSHANTFCDHCHKLLPCERVSTALGVKWFCADAMQKRRARPVGTLSDAQLREIEERRLKAEREIEDQRRKAEASILDEMEILGS